MNAKKIINWAELSRILSGSRQTVRKDSIPLIHQKVVNEILETIEKILSTVEDKSKSVSDCA